MTLNPWHWSSNLAVNVAVTLKCTILEGIDFDIHKKRFWADSKFTLS